MRRSIQNTLTFRNPLLELSAVRNCQSMWVRGVVPHSMEHPVLLSPYFHIWILRTWAASLRGSLSDDLCGRILDLLPTNWHATTVAEVIHQLGRDDQTPGSIKLVLGGRLKGLEAGARTLMEFAPERFATVCVPDLSFVKLPDEPAAGQLGPVINLSVYSQDGRQRFFRTRKRKLLVHLMFAWCNASGIGINAVRFLFDLSRVSADQTPETCGMEDGDELDVVMAQCGD